MPTGFVSCWPEKLDASMVGLGGTADPIMRRPDLNIFELAQDRFLCLPKFAARLAGQQLVMLVTRAFRSRRSLTPP